MTESITSMMINSGNVTSILLKIDDMYKLVSGNTNDIIKYHKIIYGNDIIYNNIYVNKNILKIYNITDEYGFFENENDIETIIDTFNKLNHILYDVNKIFKPIEYSNENIGIKLYYPVKENIYSKTTEFRETPKLNTPTLTLTPKSTSVNIGILNNINNYFNNYAPASHTIDYYIFFNKFFLTVLIIKKFDYMDSVFGSDTKFNIYFPELKLIKEVSLKNEEEKNAIYNDIKYITDEEELVNTIDCILKKYIDIDTNTKPSFEKIKLYINKVYTITSNLEDRIQFNDIYKQILKDINIKEEYKSTIYKILPLVLKDIGLDKKRYSNGIYWYGLKYKDNLEPIVNKYNNQLVTYDMSSIEKINETDLMDKVNQLINHRAEDIIVRPKEEPVITIAMLLSNNKN